MFAQRYSTRMQTGLKTSNCVGLNEWKKALALLPGLWALNFLDKLDECSQVVAAYVGDEIIWVRTMSRTDNAQGAARDKIRE